MTRHPALREFPDMNLTVDSAPFYLGGITGSNKYGAFSPPPKCKVFLQ
jgi:hypothetical protein